MRTKIKNLEQAGISEDDIVRHLKISHLAYRRLSTKKTHQRLSAQALREVRHKVKEPEDTLANLIKDYKTVFADIHKALYSERIEIIRQPSYEEVCMFIQEYNPTRKQIKQRYALTEAKLSEILLALGFGKQTRSKEAPILATLVNTALTYKQIADQHECSRQYVAAIAKKHGIIRTARYDIDPRFILRELKHKTPTQIAKENNISRSLVYHYARRVHHE